MKHKLLLKTRTARLSQGTYSRKQKATIEISAELFLFIIGRSVSIAVAPATDTDSREPIYFAINGTDKIDKISLNTFVRKARLPSSALIFESSMAEREYHPSPALTAIPCPVLRVKKRAYISSDK